MSQQGIIQGRASTKLNAVHHSEGRPTDSINTWARIQCEDAPSGEGGDVMVLRRTLPSGLDRLTNTRSGAAAPSKKATSLPMAGASRGYGLPPLPRYSVFLGKLGK